MNNATVKIAQVKIGVGPPVRCVCPPTMTIHEGDPCIVDDDGVLEYGTVASLSAPGPSDETTSMPTLVRQATLQDQSKEKETELRSKMAVETCAKAAEKYGLQMRLVDVRFSFDRRMLYVLFSADGRLDFREMVRDLSRELNARVRMTQIGVRDEAGIIGGMGPCGRRMCCCSWLKKFESINVRMAKTQRIAMNPNTISGMCGRLKCCLRYENDQYQESDHDLPRDGARVVCPAGDGLVVDKDIMCRRVRVQLGDRRIQEFDAADVRCR